MKPGTWVVAFAVLQTGCATVAINGVTVLEEAWQRDSVEVRNRASFDLGCSADKLSLTILSTQKYLDGTAPAVIGVTGCEKKATYIHLATDRYHKTWTLERGVESAGPAQ